MQLKGSFTVKADRTEAYQFLVGSRDDIPQGIGRAIHQTTAQTKVAKATRPL